MGESRNTDKNQPQKVKGYLEKKEKGELSDEVNFQPDFENRQFIKKRKVFLKAQQFFDPDYLLAYY